MTDRTTDIHCDRCHKYMHSIGPLEKVPVSNVCSQCDANPVGVLASLMDGGWIERYHIKGQRMLTRQSVAEHSWRLAAVIFAVARKPRAELVLAALFHDVSERVTGDMPSNVKRANPVLAQALREVSMAEEIRLGIRFDLSEQEQRLLAWADRYEGAMHCLDEYTMGNRFVVKTMLRYYEYCSGDEYKLKDPNEERRRNVLMQELEKSVSHLL